MSIGEIERMIAEKGKPCISIIIPTIRYTQERQQNPELISKAIHKAQILVKHSHWSKQDIEILQNKLGALQEKLEPLKLEDGLAVYISPNIFNVYLLPVAVKEKVMLDDSFEVRDLFYFNQFLEPYYLIALSKKRVRLFRGSGRNLQEIVNSDFPRVYVDDYEYAKPTVGTSSAHSLKSYERDKSVLNDIRTKKFFKNADTSLKKYVKNKNRLFVAGVMEEIVDFEQVSVHSKQIAATIRGNYDVDAIHPLAETAWNKIKEDVRTSNKTLLDKLEELFGSHLAIDGIIGVWRAASEGRGATLLLEKDYQQRGYLKVGEHEKLLTSPPVENHEVVQDAADDLIEIVKDKGGRIAIFENGELEKFQHIALLLRY